MREVYVPRRRLIPLPDELIPDVSAGDLVLCREAGGDWVTMLALDSPRYDRAAAFGEICWLSVPVADPAQWTEYTGTWCNWPATAVRRHPSRATLPAHQQRYHRTSPKYHRRRDKPPSAAQPSLSTDLS